MPKLLNVTRMDKDQDDNEVWIETMINPRYVTHLTASAEGKGIVHVILAGKSYAWPVSSDYGTTFRALNEALQ